MKLAVLLVLLSAASTSFYIQSDLRSLDCNEVLNKEGVFLLPRRASCDVVVLNDQRVLLELWSAGQGGCEKIKLIDEDGQEESLCVPSRTNGFGKRYTLRVDGLESEVELAVSYIPTSFTCPGRIDANLFEIPFNITTNGQATCPFAFYSSGFLNLRLVSSQSSEPVKVEIRQGRHITNIALSSGVVPLRADSEFSRFPLFCGIHMLLVYGPPSTVEVVMEATSRRQYDEYAIRRILECPL